MNPLLGFAAVGGAIALGTTYHRLKVDQLNSSADRAAWTFVRGIDLHGEDAEEAMMDIRAMLQRYARNVLRLQ